MAQMTLLQMTQSILSALDSDEVNSISDTVESLQVANIIQNKYFDILTRGDLPETKQFFQLTPSLDTTRPVLMTIPAGVSKIEWIKYFDVNPIESQQVDQFGSFSHGLNLDLVLTSSWTTTSTTSNTISNGNKTFTVASSTLPIQINQGVQISADSLDVMTGTVLSYTGTTLVVSVTSSAGSGTFSSWTISSSLSTLAPPGYKYVTLLPIDEFLDMVNRFNPTDISVGSFQFQEGGNSFTFYYKNNIQPRWCTIITNSFVVFDAFAMQFDSTLQGSKTLVYGQVVPPFQLVDSFIPDIDDNQFPLLLNESKSLAFYELKQMPHIKADQEIKRQWSAVQKDKSKVNKPSYFDQLPNMGRVPRTGGYSSGGYGVYKWMRQSGP